MANFNKSMQQFKNFNRRRRVQYSEESFAYGIKYVTSPLELGFARNLINFDLKNEGDSLAPREGLRTFEISQETDLSTAQEYDNTMTYPEKQIYYASENVEEDGKTYRCILLGNIDDVVSNSKIIKKGHLDLITIYPQGDGGNIVNYSKAEDLNVLAQHTEHYNSEDYEFYFNSPDKASVHGITLENSKVIGSHIGTGLAAEGTKKYYCFRKNVSTDKVEPVFITFDNVNKYYKFEVLEPQTTTAYNASLSMYNMLQDNPYMFTDSYNASTLQFMGVYTTDLKGNKRQATYINTEYLFRMNYATAQGQKYKVVWEWREPNAANWTEIETQYYDFSENIPPVMQIKWVSPVRAAIIRVQAFPYDSSKETVDIVAFTAHPDVAPENSKYFDPNTRKIYTYSEGAWDDGVLPLTSVFYKRIEDDNQLYRWAGNMMVDTDMYDYISTQVMLVNVTFGESMSNSTQNLDYTNYDLSTCKGMVTWGQRVCVYAPDKALNMLFVSEPNNPAWFPFPRNISLFNEDIIHCTAYLDYLLVFTTDAIYQLTMNSDGDSWTERCLQKNMNIQVSDIPFIKIIKNMVFFKSNNYFYMVVPSSKSTTGLSIAPITTNIEQFLDNFKEAVDEIMLEVYDNKREYELVYYKNHVNYQNIYNVYTFKTVMGMYCNILLIYNIESRYWSIYCIESKSFIESYKIDIADVNIYMEYTPVIINGRISDSLQFLKYEKVNRHDFYIHPYLTPADDVKQICLDKMFFKNYQYIDTGYREHESDFKKRYRELQFKLNNYAQVTLSFYTQFMIDGYIRQDDSEYQINQIKDPNDPRYGVITYDRVYSEESSKQIVGSTILGETELLDGFEHNPNELVTDKLMWRLDFSSFPETVFWKSRFPVSGKGYVPRLKILNMDQESYEILNISWVFRMLYSR